MITVKKGWIVSPWTDTAFIFGGSILAFLLLSLLLAGRYLPLPGNFGPTLSLIANDASITTLFVIMFSLNGGHMVAGLFLLLSSKTERHRAQTVDPHLYLRCFLIAVTSTALFAAAFVLFVNRQGSKSFEIPIQIAGLIYFLWNGWHFAMQQFGLLQLYRKKSKIVSRLDRQMDLSLSFLLFFLVPSLLLFSVGRNDDFFKHQFGSLEILAAFKFEILFAVFVAACFVIFRVTVMRHWRWPLFFCYAGMFLVPIGMSYNPVVFLFMAVLGPHYLQEIFLISTLSSTEKSQNEIRINFNKIVFLFCGFAVASALFYYVLDVRKEAGGWIDPFGFYRLEPGLEDHRFFVVAAIAAILATFNFFHFYLDRVIYSQRRELP